MRGRHRPFRCVTMALISSGVTDPRARWTAPPRARARTRIRTRPGGKAKCPEQPFAGKAKWPNGDLAGIWRSALEIIGFFRKRSEGPFLALYLAEGRGLALPASLLGARGPRRGRPATRPGHAGCAFLHRLNAAVPCAKWRGSADGWVCRAATEAGQLSAGIGAPAAGPAHVRKRRRMIKASRGTTHRPPPPPRSRLCAPSPSRWPYARRCF